MEYVKKKFVDEENRVISWFSTDDNVLCSDGKTLREKIDGENITYISPKSKLIHYTHFLNYPYYLPFL